MGFLTVRATEIVIALQPLQETPKSQSTFLGFRALAAPSHSRPLMIETLQGPVPAPMPRLLGVANVDKPESCLTLKPKPETLKP